MKSTLIKIAALTLISHSALAQNALSSEEYTKAKALVASAADNLSGYHVVRDMTTEVGQRLGGSEADARGVDWMQKRFKALGFDKVWLEPVTFPKWVRGSESANINAPYQQVLKITALGGSVGTNGVVSADIVMFDDLVALEDADPKLLKGKIAYVAKQMFKHIQGASYGHVVVARSKGASIAEKKGAVAFLLRSVGTDSHRFPHTGMMSTPAGIAAAALSNPDADQIERLLANGHNVSVSLDITAGFDGEYTSHNVIAEMTGSEKPDEIVVIGGHLDSWDLGTGAIDDAAGVGITTGAAVHLIQQGIKPKRTLRVVAFSNEEQGLLGGKAFAAAHGNKDNIIVASESDFGAGRIWGWQTKIDGYSDEWHAQAKSLLMDLGVSYQGNTADSGGPDIGPMFRMGVPVFELNQDGRDYFDLHHTADDTFDKIDPASFQQNVQAWVAMITMFLQSN